MQVPGTILELGGAGRPSHLETQCSGADLQMKHAKRNMPRLGFACKGPEDAQRSEATL